MLCPVQEWEMEARLDFTLVLKHGTWKGRCKKGTVYLLNRVVSVTLMTLPLGMRMTLHSAVPPAKF